MPCTEAVSPCDGEAADRLRRQATAFARHQGVDAAIARRVDRAVDDAVAMAACGRDRDPVLLQADVADGSLDLLIATGSVLDGREQPESATVTDAADAVTVLLTPGGGLQVGLRFWLTGQ